MLFFLYFVFVISFCKICPLGFIQHFIIKGIDWYLMFKLVVIIVVTLIFGKIICGWICPVGFIFEVIYKIRMKIFKEDKLLKINERIHQKLIYLKYIMLVVLLILTFYLLIYVYCKGCPIWFLTHLRGSHLAIIVSIIGIIISFIIPMGFCRYICPLGAFFSIFSIKPLFQLRTNDKCTKCNLCEDICPMQIKITENIDQKECIRCFECKSVCKDDAISFTSIFKK
ncbi:MAG: 4Fe-4S binding protein [Methanocaldococcus sp.]